MDHSLVPRPVRRRPESRSDPYSTFIIHQNDGGAASPRPPKPSDDIYSTVVYKGNGNENVDFDDEDSEDDASLPPLLKRLPKDFGGGAATDDEDGSDFGTMIVKPDRSTRPPPPKPHREDNEDFSTFVVRSGTVRRTSGNVDGTVVRRTSGGGGGGGNIDGTVVRRTSGGGSVDGTVVWRTSAGDGDGTVVSRKSGGNGSGGGFVGMERAVASMQAVGEMGGFGKQRKGSGAGSQGEDRLHSKISSSSITEYVTREDPTTKYELLHELGELVLFPCVTQFAIGACLCIWKVIVVYGDVFD